MKKYVFKNGDDEKDDHPDISHIPNDQPIPSENPEKAPPRIPADEPGAPDIPGPKITPVKEPGRNPKIHVLNIEY